VLKVDTKGSQGSVHRTARVTSNDPARPDVQLGMKIFVNAPITFEPRGVMLGGPAGAEVKQTVDVRAHLDKPLELDTGENTLPDKVAFEVVPVAEGKQYRVVLKNISTTEEDRYSGSITLKTNYEEQPQVVIHYIGYVWKPGTEVPGPGVIAP
jgi:hypothetical protein